MELVAAGLRYKRHVAAAGMAVFRLEAVGIDGELIDGFDGGGVRRHPAFGKSAAGIGGNAVQRGAVGGRLAAAEAEAVVAAEILRIGNERGEIEGGTDGSADDERQVVDQLILQRDAGLRIFRLQLHGGGGDFHGLRGGSDFE